MQQDGIVAVPPATSDQPMSLSLTTSRSSRLRQIIAIVGSRTRTTTSDFEVVRKKFTEIWFPNDKIVSGGCPTGADAFAEVLAIELVRPAHYERDALLKMEPIRRHHIIKELGAPIIIHPPLLQRYGSPVAFFKRNTLIARDATVMIAAVSHDRRGGTENAIAQFLRKASMEDLYIV